MIPETSKNWSSYWGQTVKRSKVKVTKKENVKIVFFSQAFSWCLTKTKMIRGGAARSLHVTREFFYDICLSVRRSNAFHLLRIETSSKVHTEWQGYSGKE